jgi:hypothetical protein
MGGVRSASGRRPFLAPIGTVQRVPAAESESSNAHGCIRRRPETCGPADHSTFGRFDDYDGAGRVVDALRAD